MKEISHAYKKLTSEYDDSDEELEYSFSPADIITELFGQFFSGMTTGVKDVWVSEGKEGR